MNLKLKLKKNYNVILNKVYKLNENVLSFEESLIYSTTHVVPGQNTVAIGSIISVPVSEFITLSSKKVSWMFEYQVKSIDHENRSISAEIIGFKTIPLWKSSTKMPRNELFYDPITKTELVYQYSNQKRITSNLRKEVRFVIAAVLKRHYQDRQNFFKGCITGEILNQIQKSLVEKLPEDANLLKGGYVLKTRLF